MRITFFSILILLLLLLLVAAESAPEKKNGVGTTKKTSSHRRLTEVPNVKRTKKCPGKQCRTKNRRSPTSKTNGKKSETIKQERSTTDMNGNDSDNFFPIPGNVVIENGVERWLSSPVGPKVNPFHEHAIVVQMGKDQHGECSMDNMHFRNFIARCLRFADQLNSFFYRRADQCFFSNRKRGWFKVWAPYCDTNVEKARYWNYCSTIKWTKHVSGSTYTESLCEGQLEREAKSHGPYTVEFDKNADIEGMCFVTFLTPTQRNQRRHSMIGRCDKMLRTKIPEHNDTFCYAVYKDSRGRTKETKYSCSKGRMRNFGLHPNDDWNKPKELKRFLKSLRL